jgi:hypothetical protein
MMFENGCFVSTAQSVLLARKQKALHKAVEITFGADILSFRKTQST